MKYLVIYNIEGERNKPKLKSASQIFDTMDLDDCYDITIEALYIIIETQVRKCIFKGTWTNPNDPLLMTIADAETGEIYDTCHGTDH